MMWWNHVNPHLVV